MRERWREAWADPMGRRVLIASVLLLFWIIFAELVAESEERKWTLVAVGFAFGAYVLATWAARDAAKRNRDAEQEAARMIELLESIDRRLAESATAMDDPAESGANSPEGPL